MRETSEKNQISNIVITLLEHGRLGISHPENRSMGLADAIRVFNDVIRLTILRVAIFEINLNKSLADLEDYRNSVAE